MRELMDDPQQRVMLDAEWITPGMYVIDRHPTLRRRWSNWLWVRRYRRNLKRLRRERGLE